MFSRQHVLSPLSKTTEVRSAEGTTESSPAIDRGVLVRKIDIVPTGTAEAADYGSAVPYGTRRVMIRDAPSSGTAGLLSMRPFGTLWGSSVRSEANGPGLVSPAFGQTRSLKRTVLRLVPKRWLVPKLLRKQALSAGLPTPLKYRPQVSLRRNRRPWKAVVQGIVFSSPGANEVHDGSAWERTSAKLCFATHEAELRAARVSKRSLGTRKAELGNQIKRPPKGGTTNGCSSCRS